MQSSVFDLQKWFSTDYLERLYSYAFELTKLWTAHALVKKGKGLLWKINENVF